MTTRTIALTDALLDYVAVHDSSRDPLIAELIAETRAALPDEYDLQVSRHRSRRPGSAPRRRRPLPRGVRTRGRLWVIRPGPSRAWA